MRYHTHILLPCTVLLPLTIAVRDSETRCIDTRFHPGTTQRPAQDRPRPPKTAPRSPLDRPRHPKRPPRAPQKAPKTTRQPQRSLPEPARPRQEPPRRPPWPPNIPRNYLKSIEIIERCRKKSRKQTLEPFIPTHRIFWD